MKVLLTADTLGGVWTFAAELAGALSRRGCTVLVAALGRAPTADQLSLVFPAGVAVCECALEWMPEPWDDVRRSGEWLLDLTERFEPDVVHVNGYAHGALPFDAPVVVGAHSCVLSWFEAVHGTAAPPEWTRYREEVEHGLDAAGAVVAPTRAMRDALHRHYAFTTETHVIANGRSAPAPSEKQRVIVSAGRVWDEAKNIGAVERVAPELPWEVRIVGEGSARGRVPQALLGRWLGEAAIFALPARYEPFGLGPLEAAGAGCALVLGDIESLREVWGNAAAYVDPADERALAATLRRLIDDAPLRDRLADAARRRARELTPDGMGAAYLALYERVGARARPMERV